MTKKHAETEQGDLLKIREVAALLKVCEKTIRTWTGSGFFPKPVWFGARKYWERAVVEDFVRRCTLLPERPQVSQPKK